MRLTKKCSIIITYLLLERESDPRTPLSQTHLAEFATSVGCPCDRKTIGRDIKALQAMGCPIKKQAKGYYMDKKEFSLDEANFVFDCIKNTPAEDVDKPSLLARLAHALGHKYV